MVQAAPPTATAEAEVETAPVETTKSEAKPKVSGQAIDLPEDFVVFDIETGPLPDATLKQLCPPFEPPAHPGEFDPTAVKCGNLGPEKTAAKIKTARIWHAEAVAKYSNDIKGEAAEHFAKFRDRAALDATTGRVVAIGVASRQGVDIFGTGSSTSNLILSEEAFVLREWWQAVEECLRHGIPMIGFNIKHFDLPFLVRRSWILGVPIPSGVRVGRYWSELFIDLMEIWQQGGREMVSLDTLCAAFGLPSKVTEVNGVEVSGATFHQLWESDCEVAKKYLEGDVLLPAELARRMQVV